MCTRGGSCILRWVLYILYRGGSCTRTMMCPVHTLGWVLYLYYDESCIYSRGGSCTRTMMGPVHTLGVGSVLVLQ